MSSLKISSVLFCCLLSLCTMAQEHQRIAQDLYGKENYIDAINSYRNALKKDPESAELNYEMGICYLKTNIDKAKAIPYLQNAVQFSKSPEEALFYLGKAYTYNYEFDKAIETLKEFKDKAAGNNKHIEEADRIIENSLAAKEMMKFPINVVFENMGELINSEMPDYYPYVTKNDCTLFFTTRRKDNFGALKEFDGYYSSDIWMAKKMNGTFLKASNLGRSINTSDDEQAVGLSDNGDKLFIYIDHIDEFGDIYMAKVKENGTWTRREKLGENVNSKKFETAASLSSDENTLFFASERPDGYGGQDIYMSRKLPDGQWGLPQNLGEKINTDQNEDFPTLSFDNKTLYFTSEGHLGMGGYDIFYANWDPEQNVWTEPKNIGYPLNTPDDNMTISFTEDKKQAYISAVRKEGFGDLDIYQITYEDAIKPAVFELALVTSDSLSSSPNDAFISVSNTTDEVIGTYTPNPNNGKSVVILREGEYILDVVADGYKAYAEKITVSEKDTQKTIIRKKIRLTK